MAQLSSEAVAAIDHVSIDDNTRSDTRAERDHDEVLHAACYAILHLADGGSVGVVGEAHGDAKLFREHICQWNHTVMAPGHIGGKLYRAAIVVAVGRTDAHGFDLLYAAYFCNDGLEGLHASRDKVLCGLVCLRLNRVGCQYVATLIYDSKN